MAKKSSSSCVLVTGNDEDGIKQRALELSHDLCPNPDDPMALEIIDGAAETVDRAAQSIGNLMSALQTGGLFASERLVWWKNVTLMSDTVIGRSNSVLEPLQGLIELLKQGLPPETRFLASVLNPDKRRSGYKELSKVCETEVLAGIDSNRAGWEEDIADLARKLLQERKIEAEESLLYRLAQRIGTDLRQLRNEIEKLDLYLGSRRELQNEDIDLMTAISRQGVIFELGNALMNRQVRRALSLLQQLLTQNETAVGILLATMVPTVRNLLLSKDLIVRNNWKAPRSARDFVSQLDRCDQAELEHLPRKKDGSINGYALAFAAMQTDRYELDELMSALEACADAYEQVVTTSVSHDVLLSNLIVKIAGVPSKN
ncbi:MAG: DNA polymerase III subunit delta [Verrucomicrobiales bacterium]